MEMKCDVLLKATKVDYVYDKDPVKFKDAKKYLAMSYQEIIEKGLEVMDLTCASMCKEGKMPMIVFNLNKKGNIFVGRFYVVPEKCYSIWKSTNHGNTWKSFELDTFCGIQAITENKKGYLLAASNRGFYTSINEGDSWEKICSREFNPTCLASDTLGNFYAGTDGEGVYTSTDNGFTWTEQNSGLENYYVNSILCDTDGTLYAATSGGIYKSTTFTGIKEIPFLTGTDDGLTISPNIIENYSIITYSVTSEVQIRLSIVNSLGMEVAVLDEGIKVAGSYNYNLAVADLNLQTGLYFINLISGSKNWTEKIFVLRN